MSTAEGFVPAPRLREPGCPEWCAGHSYDEWSSDPAAPEEPSQRWHGGPTFGPYVHADALQVEGVRRLRFCVSVEAEVFHDQDGDGLAVLEQLAADVRSARRWLLGQVEGQ